MLKTLTLVWYFYKPLFLLSLFFSLFTIYLVSSLGSKFIPLAVAIKMVGYMFYKHHFANRTCLYFLNAGQSVKKLYVYSIGLDFTAFTVLLTCLILAK